MKARATTPKTEFIDPFVFEINKNYGSAIDAIAKMLVVNEDLQRRMNKEFERLNRISIFFEGKR